jgi:hypothetical protein
MYRASLLQGKQATEQEGKSQRPMPTTPRRKGYRLGISLVSIRVDWGPSKMTFGTSNLLVFFLAEGCMIIKGVLDSTRPGLHNGLRKIRKS